MQFSITTLPTARLIAGVANQNFEIREVWELLHKEIHRLPNKIDAFPEGESFGICCRVIDDPQKNHFSYLAGVPVTDLNSIVLPFFGQVIPAGTYATFDCVDIESITETYKYIYEVWFPTSGYRQSAPFDFERYELRDGVEEIQIWVPVAENAR